MATSAAGVSARKQRQITINKSDIPENMSVKVIEKLNEAMDSFQIEKDIATTVKKKCDEEFGGTWHCVVGRNFGCSITHDTKYAMFLQLDQTHVLLFKSID